MSRSVEQIVDLIFESYVIPEPTRPFDELKGSLKATLKNWWTQHLPQDAALEIRNKAYYAAADVCRLAGCHECATDILTMVKR